MIQLIVGGKGSGKTKTLIEKSTQAAQSSKGNVVCIEKGSKLKFDLPKEIRLIDSDEYKVKGFPVLYGFIAGLLAGNYDITHLFIDGTFKIGSIGNEEKDYDGFVTLVQNLDAIKCDADIIFTVSCDAADLPITMKDYIA